MRRGGVDSRHADCIDLGGKRGAHAGAALMDEGPARDEVLSAPPLADLVAGPVIVDEVLMQTRRVYVPLVLR
ncbi:MAG: hypothetical protein HC893_04490 [Chloroflexaceae bacterium]|nr:hypothetical protein [Chloroflexaceae bacterium]